MVKQFIKFIAGVVAAVACVVGFAASDAVDALDQQLLLERRHPEYFRYFRDITYQYVSTDVVEYGIINLIENDLETTEYEQGFTITAHADGSITYSGTNEGADAVDIVITSDTWELPDGSYVLSDSSDGTTVSTADCRIVVSEHSRQNRTAAYTDLVDMAVSRDGSFVVDNDRNRDYCVRLVVEPGFSSDGIIFYPMVTTAADVAEEYHPSIQLRSSTASGVFDEEADVVCYDAFKVDKDAWLAFSDEDRELVDRRIRYQHQGEWTVIDFMDGTGIQYFDNDPDQTAYGALNHAGQVTDVYSDTEYGIE